MGQGLLVQMKVVCHAHRPQGWAPPRIFSLVDPSEFKASDLSPHARKARPSQFGAECAG